MCGSTLLSENFALTASHCAQAPIENKLVQPGALKPKIVRFGVEKLYVNILFLLRSLFLEADVMSAISLCWWTLWCT